VKFERAEFTAICFALLLLVIGCRGGTIAPLAPNDGARRIISLAPSVTEILFAIGAGPEVVGVSMYCDYPPAVTKLPKVGTFLTPNIEAIAALRPSMVIGPGTTSDMREMRALREMGITVIAISGEDSIAQIEATIEQVGQRVGRAESAKRLIDQINAHIDSIEERLKGSRKPIVLMVVGHQPMVAVGRGTFLGELLNLAHSENIAEASSQPWPRLSLEYIIATRPDVILDGRMGSDPDTPSSFWGKYQSIPAVRDHRVYGYPEDPTLHPGPRVAKTLELLARLIHPEAFTSDATHPTSGPMPHGASQ
jgi:iron complex transport system substrate-binding protein